LWRVKPKPLVVSKGKKKGRGMETKKFKNVLYPMEGTSPSTGGGGKKKNDPNILLLIKMGTKGVTEGDTQRQRRKKFFIMTTRDKRPQFS